MLSSRLDQNSPAKFSFFATTISYSVRGGQVTKPIIHSCDNILLINLDGSFDSASFSKLVATYFKTKFYATSN